MPTALVLTTIGVPLLGALTIPLVSLLGRSARTVWANLLAFGTTASAALLIPRVLAGTQGAVLSTTALSFIGIHDLFQVDALALFVALASSGIGALIVLYSTGYIAHTDNETEYYTMVLLFIGSMMGLVFSANLIFLYIFWEIAGICSWRLIGYYRQPEYTRKADKAFLVTFMGASLDAVRILPHLLPRSNVRHSGAARLPDRVNRDAANLRRDDREVSHVPASYLAA